jgi:hypothetical protein
MARLDFGGLHEDRETAYRRREAAEPTEKPCRECGETKPAEAYKRVPVGGRGHTCEECLKARKTLRQKRLENSEELIIDELWKQYDETESASEKIRCLEALVKLRPTKNGSEGSKLSPEAVASLVRAMKAKRQAGASDAG